MNRHEGRGFGHHALMQVHERMRQLGWDPSEHRFPNYEPFQRAQDAVYEELFGKPDNRDYDAAVQVLQDFGIGSVSLTTGNRCKRAALVEAGVEVSEHSLAERDLIEMLLTDWSEYVNAIIERRERGERFHFIDLQLRAADILSIRRRQLETLLTDPGLFGFIEKLTASSLQALALADSELDLVRRQLPCEVFQLFSFEVG
jgi:hypothetical protein